MAKKIISQALNQYNENYATSRINPDEFKLFNNDLKKFNVDIQDAINKDESEVLYQRNSSFIVTAIRTQNSKTNILLKECY